MRRKIDLIQQIRALESVPIVRHKFVDPTETSGHGLLAEMSIAEVSISVYSKTLYLQYLHYILYICL